MFAAFRNLRGVPLFLTAALFLLFSFVPEAKACLEGPYKPLSYHCVTQSSFDKLFNVLNSDAKPRHIAVLAGVSKYPSLPSSLQLPPAARDIEKLRNVLVNNLKFDEVIVLQEENFTQQNLSYIFVNYLPDLLQRNPKSRVLFAFSGHGSFFGNRGFLYFSNTKTIDAQSFTQLTEAIDLGVLRSILGPTMANAQHFLAMINACYGGSFLDMQVAFGDKDNPLEQRGAHGITAGGNKTTVHSYPVIGPGSVFFEMVVAALSGGDVTVNGKKFDNPAKATGILTATKLHSFLYDTISLIENYSVSPAIGRLTPRGAGNEGEFFFITNYDAAKAALTDKFPKEAARVFGPTPATVTNPERREPGLYAKAGLSAGVRLRDDMFSSVEEKDRQKRENAAAPLVFPDHVSGSCLNANLSKDERLTWDHLRSDCR